MVLLLFNITINTNHIIEINEPYLNIFKIYVGHIKPNLIFVVITLPISLLSCSGRMKNAKPGGGLGDPNWNHWVIAPTCYQLS